MMKTWREQAACRDLDPELFFPASDEDTPKGRGDRDAAKAVCAGCPVRAQCLAFGLDEPVGVWGGLSESERRAVRRGVTVDAPPEPLAPAA
ncbi:MAG TPA: WhiB family transcriptional regulator [Actinomycetospora sp.]|jgi:WhiB family redox-sensing transcriptional regulator|uniref:WhiB family transcriptional regulator n=1 Tax=Actinomycetospora sp. TaxID=1872135 RepID=UPI002F3FAC62